MMPDKESKVVLGIAVVLLVIGVACYSVFAVRLPDEPVRLMFPGTAGNVLFTHALHADDYGVDCDTCHHNLEDDEIYNCSECHEPGVTGEDADPMGRTDALHDQCIGCHDEEGAGPTECSACHASKG